MARCVELLSHAGQSVASMITVRQVGELPRVAKLNSVYTPDGDGGDADVGVRWVWEGC